MSITYLILHLGTHDTEYFTRSSAKMSFEASRLNNIDTLVLEIEEKMGMDFA